MRNIAFRLILRQCCWTSWFFCCCPFFYTLLKDCIGKTLPCFDSALYLTIWLRKTKATRGWLVFKYVIRLAFLGFSFAETGSGSTLRTLGRSDILLFLLLSNLLKPESHSSLSEALNNEAYTEKLFLFTPRNVLYFRACLDFMFFGRLVLPSYIQIQYWIKSLVSKRFFDFPSGW